jgi:NACalpha-BTF3-like transcription factor
VLMMSRRMDPRAMRRMMNKMGLKIEEFGDCTEVIFRMASGKELAIQSPQVTRMKTGGQDVFQVAGKLEERTPQSHEIALTGDQEFLKCNIFKSRHSR